MSIHSIEEKHDQDLKPLSLSGEKLLRYEYCGFTANTLAEIQEQVESLGLQWHPTVVIDTQTGQKVGHD